MLEDDPFSVVQPWVTQLCSLKMQTVLFAAVRGPDSAYCPNLKPLTRWIRSLVLKNADTNTPFMQDITLPEPQSYAREIEYLSVHYVAHLISALEVIMYMYPDATIGKHAWTHLSFIVTGDIFHMRLEPLADMVSRLKDAPPPDPTFFGTRHIHV